MQSSARGGCKKKGFPRGLAGRVCWKGDLQPKGAASSTSEGSEVWVWFREILTRLAACAIIQSLQNIWRRRLGPRPRKQDQIRETCRLFQALRGVLLPSLSPISPLVKQRHSPLKGNAEMMLGTKQGYSVPAGKLARAQIYLLFPASATLEKCPEMGHVLTELLGEDTSTLLLSSAPVPRTTGSRALWGRRICVSPCRICLSRSGEGPSGNP